MANLPALTPTNFAEAMTFAEALAQSTMIPTAFQRNASNILVAIQWGAELGLGPLQALQNIAVIGGRPAVYGDAMLALVRGSPVCDDIIEHIEKDGDNRIAICEARRKGKAPVIGRFSINDARRAGLWGKPGPWKQYPLRMLQMRARGFALRDAFPDILRGVISAEEAGDIVREERGTAAHELRGTEALRARLTAVAAPAPELDDLPEADPETPSEDDAVSAMGGEGSPASLSPEPREQQGEEQPGLLPPEEIPVVKPGRKAPGTWDWQRYADEYIAAARTVPIPHLGIFRGANASMFDVLRQSDREQWQRANQALADYERGDEQ